MKPIRERIILDSDMCNFFINYFEDGNVDIIERDKRYGSCGREGVIPHKNIPNDFFSIFPEIDLRPFTFLDDHTLHTLLVRKYVVGDSFPLHKDNNILNYDSKDSDRTKRYRAYIFQLSNPSTYIGGDLLFDNYVADTSQGNCIDFDANLYHSVSEVTSGVRYSMAFWVERSDIIIPQQIL